MPMNKLTDIISSIILIAGPIAGFIASLITGPSIFSAKTQWLKRSFLSSYLLILGFFPIFLTWSLSDLKVFGYREIANSILHLLIYCVIGGAVLAILTFIRILLLERFSKNVHVPKK
jgi:hypothetical protein